jgi:hypothetical protein
MKKIIALLSLAAVAAAPLSAAAADASVTLDVLSAYVFNGQIGNDEAVFQPALDVEGPLGFAFSLWANMDLTDNEISWGPNSAGKWSEIDLGLSWTVPYDAPVSLTLGGTYYVYPQAVSDVDEDGVASVGPADGSYEIYATFAADDVLLAPSLTLAHDLDNTDDWYALVAVAHSFEVADALSLDLGAAVGYAGDYYVETNYGSVDGAAFTHVQLDAGLTYAASEALSLGLVGSFSSILDGDLRDSIEDSEFYPEVDIFFGGLTATYSF